MSTVKQKRSSGKLPQTQTDDESDDLAIKKTKAPRKVNKGKARSTDSLPEIFESAGTDIDLEDSRPGPSNPLSAEERASSNDPPNVHEETTTSILHRVASDRGNASEEEEQQHVPLPKKRGRPRIDEGGGEPPPKRGKIQKSNNDEDDDDLSTTKPRRQSKSSPKPGPATTKKRTRKEVDLPPDTSDGGRDGLISSETKAPGSKSRKRQQRKLGDGSDYRERNEPDRAEASSNPSRVRLDSIPPEGIVIRKKNGIVERLLPPVMYVRFCCLITGQQLISTSQQAKEEGSEQQGED